MTSSVRKNRVLAALLLAVMYLLPAGVGWANSLPTLTLRLEFEYDTAEQPKLEGVQILDCKTPECSHPILLKGYGTCDSEGCVNGIPILSAGQRLECQDDRCIAVLAYTSQPLDPPFKVVGQFSDRVRESTPISDNLPMPGSVVWKIVVHDSALTVTATNQDSNDSIDLLPNSFLPYFVLTLSVELLIVAAVLRGWLKLQGRNFVSGLGYVFFANLISYPATWAFSSSLSLQALQPMVTRVAGHAAVFLVAIFAGSIFILSRLDGRARRVWFIVTLGLLPLAVWATYICLFVTDYGIGAPTPVIRVPDDLWIGLEVFAVSFEASMLYLLARKTLKLAFRQTIIISFLANIPSFLGGLLGTIRL